MRTAIGHVNGEIADALRGRDFTDQAALDQALMDLDGTADKSRLGANAVIGVSMAVARAAAAHQGTPLWEHLAPVTSPRCSRCRTSPSSTAACTP